MSQRLDLKSTVEHIPLRYLTIHCTWKNIRKEYKNNKLKIIAPTWNDELQLPDESYSVSNIQNYIKSSLKSMKH